MLCCSSLLSHELQRGEETSKSSYKGVFSSQSSTFLEHLEQNSASLQVEPRQIEFKTRSPRHPDGNGYPLRVNCCATPNGGQSRSDFDFNRVLGKSNPNTATEITKSQRTSWSQLSLLGCHLPLRSRIKRMPIADLEIFIFLFGAQEVAEEADVEAMRCIL